MRVTLCCVARRPTGWARDAAEEYLKRLGGRLAVACREIQPAAAALSPAERKAREGAAILAALPAEARSIALDERGEAWTTAELARRLERWRDDARDVVLVVGGADGLSERVRDAAEALWSLSPLTLPHQLVRVIVLEQLYRAASLLAGHPYHRA